MAGVLYEAGTAYPSSWGLWCSSF